MDSDDILDTFSVYQQILPYIVNRSIELIPQIVFIGVVKPDDNGHFIAVGKLLAGGKFTIVPAKGSDPITIDTLKREPFLLGLQDTPTGAGCIPGIVTAEGFLNIPLPGLQEYHEICSFFESKHEVNQLNKDIAEHIIMIFESGEYLGEPICMETFNQILEYNDILKSEIINEFCSNVEFVDE